MHDSYFLNLLRYLAPTATIIIQKYLPLHVDYLSSSVVS